jgi:kynureninase
MSRNLANTGFYDEGLIDHRNERPLAVAFATILVVWALAFAVASVSGQLHAHPRSFADGCAAVISTMVK